MSDAGAGAQPTLPAEKTEIDDKVTLEVDILTLAALRRIAADIAGRVAETVAPGGRVVLGPEEGPAAIRRFRALEAGVDALLAEADALLRPPTEADALPKPSASPAVGTAGGAKALGAVKQAVEGIGAILKLLQAETIFEGRVLEAGAAASGLRAALAGRLVERGLKVVLPEFLPTSTRAGVGGLLAKLARLPAASARLRALAAPASPPPTQGPAEPPAPGGSAATTDGAAGPAPDDARTARAVALAALIDTFLEKLRASAEGKPSALEDAIAGAELLSLAGGGKDGGQATYWLAAKVLARGGDYRRRRSLLTLLLTGDRLTYNGGAAVAYSVVDLEATEVVAADVLHHATGHGRFGDPLGGWLQASNLRADPEPRPAAAAARGPVPAPPAAVAARDPGTTPDTGDDGEAGPGVDRAAEAPPAGAREAVAAWRGVSPRA